MMGQKVAVPPPRNAYTVWAAGGGERRELFAEHLEKILGSSVFRNSKRYAAVLRYVVERALEDSPERLKERTIGVDVFGRPADYDTASDHVVRSAMAEVRKRLAQYYQEEGEASELRIEIQPGSYLPQFRVAAPPAAPAVRISGEPELEPAPVVVPAPGGRFPWWRVGLVGIGVIAAALGVLGRTSMVVRNPVNLFWGPLFASPSPILLCIGNLEGGRPTHPTESIVPLTLRDFHTLPAQTVNIADAATLARLAGFLGSQKRAYRIATQSEADFRDLRNGPAVLIGLLNNDWTERLVGKLRYTVERPSRGKVIIRDGQRPLRTDWSMDFNMPVAEVTRDYAIILRVLDPKTDQMVVTAGGITVFGTVAAGEFLTDGRNLQQIDETAPRGWQERNLEIVISTEVIRGKSGRPKIEAVHFW